MEKQKVSLTHVGSVIPAHFPTGFSQWGKQRGHIMGKCHFWNLGGLFNFVIRKCEVLSKPLYFSDHQLPHL